MKRFIVIENHRTCPYYSEENEVVARDFCWHPDKAGEIEDIEEDGFCSGCPLLREVSKGKQREGDLK